MKTNLFKKMTSLFLAAMMLLSVMPMMASATEVSDGKFWQTISVVNMDGIIKTDDTPVGGEVGWTWAGTQTVTGTSGERTIYLDAAMFSYTYRDILTNSSGIGEYTQIVAQASEDKLVNKPAAVGNGYFQLDRQWNENINRSGAPNSSIMLGKVFDEADVAVNDKVRITAYVWPSDILKIEDKTVVNETVYTDTTFSMWISERVSLGAKEIDYNHYDFSTAADDEFVTTTVKADQWNEVSLEYTITEANKSIPSIQMNSDNAAHDIVYFPQNLILGAVKVEKLADPNGSYTIEDGKKWETVNEFDFDGFEVESRDDTYGYNHLYTETINDVKHTLNIFSTNGYMHSWSGVIDASSAEVYGVGQTFDNLPSVVKTPASAKLGHIRRAWNSAKQRFTTALSGFLMPEIYGTYNPQIGETVRVSAYLYPTDTYIWDSTTTSASANTGEEDEVELTMWLSQDKSVGTEYFPSDPKGNENPGEYSTEKIKVGQWNKVSLEYEINSANAAVRGVKMYNAPIDGSTQWLFPTQMLIAGVTVEKAVEDTTETIGKITGTVAAAPAEVEAGADYKVLVGAYKVVDGVRMMLGCSIMPYEADSIYDFVINDAEGTTEVKAYLWNMNDLEPQIVPIECTYIAQ